MAALRRGHLGLHPAAMRMEAAAAGPGPRHHPGPESRNQPQLRFHYLNQVAAGVVEDGDGGSGHLCRLHRKRYAD